MVVRRFLVLFILSLVMSELSQARLTPHEDFAPNTRGSGSQLTPDFGGMARLANLFGPLQRFFPTGDSPQSKARGLIGKLYSPSGKPCTASLVGDRLILTAAHCIANESKTRVEQGSFTFLLGFHNGASRAESSAEPVDWGHLNSTNSREGDWALLRLGRSLGDEFGYFGIQNLSPLNYTNVDLYLAGYANQFGFGDRLSMARDCRFQNNTNNMKLLEHDCDSSDGDSGGPLFVCQANGCSIVAMHVADYRQGASTSVHRETYSDAYANVAVSAGQFLDAVKRHR